MRPTGLRLTAALLTFVIGTTCQVSYRAVTSYQARVREAREVVLRDDLHRMRRLIDQYAVDKWALPKSLSDLVDGGYLREIPEDPFTGRRDWVVVIGDDPNASEGAEGVIDVRSASSAKSVEGSKYNEW